MSNHKKIKILFAINKLCIGGAENVVVSQVNTLNKNKFDVFLGLLYSTTRKTTLYDKLQIPNDRIIHFNFSDLFDIRAFWRVYKFLKREKIDIVIAHLFEANMTMRLAAILARVKIKLIVEHSCYFNKSLWQKIVDNFLAYFTDIVFGVSNEVVAFTSKQEKINLKKFKVLNQISNLSTQGLFSRDDLRKQLNIPQDALVAITLGRFSPEKAQYRIIDLADLIINKKENRKIYFVIIGYGPLENKLRGQIKEKKLEKFVKMVVDPQNAKEYLVIGDIFLLTSEREGLPVAMLEAMSSGLACLAFDVGGIKDILKNNKNGWLIDKSDIQAMAEKIFLLFQDLDKLNKMKQFSIQLAKEYSGSITELENLLEKLYQSKR